MNASKVHPQPIQGNPQEGEGCLASDCGPRGLSVNDGIRVEWSSLSYATVDVAVDKDLAAGAGDRASKVRHYTG